MLETSYLENNLVGFSILSIVRMFSAFKNLYLNSKFPFAPRFVCGGPVERPVWGKTGSLISQSDCRID